MLIKCYYLNTEICRFGHKNHELNSVANCVLSKNVSDKKAIQAVTSVSLYLDLWLHNLQNPDQSTATLSLKDLILV